LLTLAYLARLGGPRFSSGEDRLVWLG
jgi:hypothetical protein